MSILFFFILIPPILYFQFYFRRIILCFYPHPNIFIRLFSWIFALLFVLPAYNLFRFWAVVVYHLFAFALICDLVMWILHQRKVHNILLNKIYHLGVIPLLCLAILLGYAYYHMQDVQTVHYTVTTSKSLSKDYTIAFISDLHFPTTMNQKKLQKYCQDISKEKPDLVLLGGDIVDERTSYQEMKQTFETLSTIESQYGIYYVYGNHDQALYVEKPAFTPEMLKQTIEDCHIHILCDEVVSIHDDIVLIGRDDRSHQRLPLETIIEDISHDKFLLLMDHQPVDLEKNNQLGIDLQVSGHTHGGQIFPVGILSQWLGFGEMNYGYRQLFSMQVIVSSGIAGWGYPLRTGSQSEYVMIHIQSHH